MLTVDDCLCPFVRKVLEEDRPHNAGKNEVFAVFRAPVEEGVFCGLVTQQDILQHPEWIFADLTEHRGLIALTLGSDVQQALNIMHDNNLSALAVLDDRKGFIGAVTYLTILEASLKQEKALLDKTKELYRQLDVEHKKTLSWAKKLSDLRKASCKLLSVLAYTSLELDLLQVGIDALVELTEAQYGAIGILDSKGSLKHFFYSGISPELVKKIGTLPTGKGLLGVVINNNVTLCLDDMTKDPRSVGFPPNHPEMKSLLAVPISHNRQRVYGRVYLSEKKNNQSFNKMDEDVALSFANSLSLVLDNARELEEIKNAKEELHYMAHFDALTALPNRTLLNDRILQAFSRANRYKTRVALFFLDLDNFKFVNDSLGHGVGDILLKLVSERIRQCLRENDTASRLGGDEFIILLPDVQKVQDIIYVAERILKVLKDPIDLKQHEIYINASIGISLYPDNGDQPNDLMAAADAAMYHAKKLGKDNYQFFTSAMNKSAQNYIELENNLRHAIENDELEVYYQPQVDINNNRIVGMEALLRWHNGENGLIPPCEFIPIAEETGFIRQIGLWVLNKACLQAQHWRQEGFTARIAVNLSTKQFYPNPEELLDAVFHALDDSGLPPELLELEITETVLMQHIDVIYEVLEQLNDKGVRIAIDDFGTGYSSLSYLKRFPIATLKIDRSFVNDIASDPNDKAIVSAIIAMAKQLNLEIIAEGVETKDQLEFLQVLSCNFVQGYYFSKPLRAQEVLLNWSEKY